MEYSPYYDKDCPEKMWDKKVQVNCKNITPRRSNMIENEVTFDGVRYYVQGIHIEKKPSTIMDKLKKIQSTPMYGLYNVVRR